MAEQQLKPERKPRAPRLHCTSARLAEARRVYSLAARGEMTWADANARLRCLMRIDDLYERTEGWARVQQLEADVREARKAMAERPYRPVNGNGHDDHEETRPC